MRLDDAYPGKYFKAEHVSETGDIYTIKAVELEELGQGADKQIKPVVYFEEDDKGLVLNKTNFKTITEVTGEGDSDNWEGQQITLFQTEVQFGAEMVSTIRIKKKVSRTPAKAAKQPQLRKPAKSEPEAVGEADTGDDDEPPF